MSQVEILNLKYQKSEIIKNECIVINRHSIFNSKDDSMI